MVPKLTNITQRLETNHTFLVVLRFEIRLHLLKRGIRFNWSTHLIFNITKKNNCTAKSQTGANQLINHFITSSHQTVNAPAI